MFAQGLTHSWFKPPGAVAGRASPGWLPSLGGPSVTVGALCSRPIHGRIRTCACAEHTHLFSPAALHPEPTWKPLCFRMGFTSSRGFPPSLRCQPLGSQAWPFPRRQGSGPRHAQPARMGAAFLPRVFSARTPRGRTLPPTCCPPAPHATRAARSQSVC